MAGATEYEISLGSGSPAGATRDRLIAALAGQGVAAEAAPDGGILVKAVSVPSLTTVATLLFAGTERGLEIDTAGTGARISVADDLPRGSLRILRWGVDTQTRHAMSAQQAGYLMRTALAAMEV